MEKLTAWTGGSERQTKLLLAAAPVAVSAAALLRRWWRDRDLPPGPSGLPLLGCRRLIDQTVWHLNFPSVIQQYGDIFSFYFGSQLIIVVTSYDAIKEMLEQNIFTGRDPDMRAIMKDAGMAFVEGEVWMHHRRATLRSLRDFGFARTRSIEMLEASLQLLYDEFDALSERREPMTPVNSLINVSNSVIGQLLFGRLFTRKDKDFAHYCDTMAEMFKTPQVSPMMQYPVLRIADKFMSVSKKMVEAFDKMRMYVDTLVQEREAAMAEGNTEPICLCDDYILHRRKAEQSGDFETYKADHLLSICVELFPAGSDTTARSVEWPLLYVAFNPELQRRVQQELHEVVGDSREATLADKPNLHYTNAVIEEGYRCASVLTNGLLHRALKDTTFRGYRIPQDARIVAHIDSCHRDPKLWDNPYQFRPERFLDANGHFQSSKYVIPFLIGKRSCPGESLARMEVFLIFSRLLQRYSLEPTEDSIRRKDEIFESRIGVVRRPGDYALILSKR